MDNWEKVQSFDALHLFNYREGRKRGEKGEQPTTGILSYPTDYLHQLCKHTPHSGYTSHT